jgi:hypothetical protein
MARPQTVPPAPDVPHALVVALELAGAVCILAGFTLGQMGRLDQHSVVYLILAKRAGAGGRG